MVAEVVPWTMPSITLNQTHLRLKMSIHTLLKTEHANINLLSELSLQLTTRMLMLMIMPHSCRHSKTDQSQLQLKLINQFSNPTVVESSMIPHAELHSITESSLLVTEMNQAKTTGSSRTHGVLTGENPATSELLTSLEKVSAVSTWLQSGQLPTEFDHKY